MQNATPPAAAETSSGLPIVLAPGFQDTERKLDKLAAYLARHGGTPAPLSPQPTDASVGLDILAAKLAGLIDERLGPDARFDLFGFSMGGLMERYYLQHFGGAARVRRFVTLATPHRGTWTARVLRSQPALEQMKPGSDFLTALNADTAHLDRVAFVALWTPFDLSVTPPARAFLPAYPHRRVFSLFHGYLLQDPLVIRAIGDCFLLPNALPVQLPSG